MAKVLIISDHSRSSHNVVKELSRFGWETESISMQSVLRQGSSITKNFDNIAFIIDENFRRNFVSVIGELQSIISNCSKYSAVYLMFEGDYEPIFAPWLIYVKRLFKSINRQADLKEAIQKMIKLSFDPIPLNSFVSPMRG